MNGHRAVVAGVCVALWGFAVLYGLPYLTTWTL